MGEMYCSVCGGEFREGVEVCPDCEVTLVPVPVVGPEPDPDLDSGDGVVVLRTGVLFEADMAASALEEAGIPYYRREQSSGGLSFAMPVAPSAGPGNWWLILVPEGVASEARAVVEGLPIEAKDSPGVWDFGPTEEGKTFLKQYARVALVLLAIFLLMGVLQILRELLGW